MINVLHYTDFALDIFYWYSQMNLPSNVQKMSFVKCVYDIVFS